MAEITAERSLVVASILRCKVEGSFASGGEYDGLGIGEANLAPADDRRSQRATFGMEELDHNLTDRFSLPSI